MQEKDNKKEKYSIKEFKNILPYYKKYLLPIIAAIIAIFLSELSFLVVGYLVGRGIELAVANNLKAAILIFLVYFVISIITGPVGKYFQKMLSLVQWKVSREIGFDVYTKTMNLPAKAFEDIISGKIIARVTRDTETLVANAQDLIHMGSYIISSLIILIYIFFNSWILGLEISIALIIFACITFGFKDKFTKIEEERKNVSDKILTLGNESIRGIRESRTLGIITNLKKIVRREIDDLNVIANKDIKLGTKYKVINSIFRNTYEAGTFILCIILLSKEQITLTFFISMTYYVYSFMNIFRCINNMLMKYQKMLVALGRVNEFLQNKLYDDVSSGEKVLENPKGIIEFKNVKFGYPNDDILLENFNVKFEPNKKIAIVGASGEGKSTLFNLITRIFDPIEGNITLDGINLTDLTEESLRKNISIVRQDPFLFNLSILENFKMLKKDVTLEEIRKYCKKVCIDEYIMTLPKKYDTVLGEGGVNLSGGQKQRLAIARSLMKESKVILFDEATSALDNESQNYIKKSIDELVKNHTILIVAHRLSTIIDADEIYIINKGKVVASGTHQKLIKENEYYRNLYSKESTALNCD